MRRIIFVAIWVLLSGVPRAGAELWVLTTTDVRSRALGNVGVALPNMAAALDANPALLTQRASASGGFSSGGQTLTYGLRERLQSAYGVIGTDRLVGRLAVAVAYREQRLTSTYSTYAYPFGTLPVKQVYRDRVLLIGAGARVYAGISVGYTLKHISHAYDNYPYQIPGSWSSDFGLFVNDLLPSATLVRGPDPETPGQSRDRAIPLRRRGLSVGASVQNFGDRSDPSGEPAKLGAVSEALSVGLSYQVVLTRPVSLLAVAELRRLDPFRKIESRAIEMSDLLRWGLEVGCYRWVDLRLGVETILTNGNHVTTAGFGVGPDRVRFEYAFLWHPQYPDSRLSRFGLSFQM